MMAKIVDPDFFEYEYIQIGSVLKSYCFACKDKTDHFYDGYKLHCLKCNPDLDPRKES